MPPRSSAGVPLAHRADRLAELLGEEHDLVVLAGLLPPPGRAPFKGKRGRRARKALLERIERRRRRLRRRALKRASGYTSASRRSSCAGAPRSGPRFAQLEIDRSSNSGTREIQAHARVSGADVTPPTFLAPRHRHGPAHPRKLQGSAATADVDRGSLPGHAYANDTSAPAPRLARGRVGRARAAHGRRTRRARRRHADRRRPLRRAHVRRLVRGDRARDRDARAARGVAGDGRGPALLEPRRTLLRPVRRRRRRGGGHAGGRLLSGDVSLPVRRARTAARRAPARAASEHVARWPDRGPRRGDGRGGDRAATDRRRGSRRHRHGRGHACLPDRRSAAVDLHDRRARRDRLASRTGVAADRREHAAERDRRLDLPLPDGHEHLSRRLPGRSDVARRGGSAGDRGLDAMAAAGPTTNRGLAPGGGARDLAARGAGGARLRQPPSPAHAGSADPRHRHCARGERAADAHGAREPRDAAPLAAPVADRRADGAGQSPAADGRPRARLPRCSAEQAATAGSVRPQRLQGLQRHLRPSRGRRAAGTAERQVERIRRRARERLPDGRRRVLRPARGRDAPTTNWCSAASRRSPSTAPALRSAPRTARRASRPRAAMRRPSCSWPTSGCTRARTGRVAAARCCSCATCCCRRSASATPTSRSTSAASARWRARSAGAWVSTARSSTCSRARRSSTTSARSRSPTRSSQSPNRSTRRSGGSCTGTRSSASAS